MRRVCDVRDDLSCLSGFLTGAVVRSAERGMKLGAAY